jgi:hypothetical protein
MMAKTERISTKAIKSSPASSPGISKSWQSKSSTAAKQAVKMRQPSGHFRSKKILKKELTCHFNEIRHGTDSA